MSDQISVSPLRVIESERRSCYQSPRLSLLGDVCSLTETGSMNGMEDLVQNGVCMLFGIGEVNMTFNMC